jgi:hypothetical protein
MKIGYRPPRYSQIDRGTGGAEHFFDRDQLIFRPRASSSCRLSPQISISPLLSLGDLVAGRDWRPLRASYQVTLSRPSRRPKGPPHHAGVCGCCKWSTYFPTRPELLFPIMFNLDLRRYIPARLFKRFKPDRPAQRSKLSHRRSDRVTVERSTRRSYRSLRFSRIARSDKPIQSIKYMPVCQPAQIETEGKTCFSAKNASL